MPALKKREKVLLGVTSVAVVVFVLNQFVCGDKSAQQTTEKPASKRAQEQEAPPTKSQQMPQVEKSTRRQEPLVTFTDWARDPFAPAYRLVELDSMQTDSSNFVLRGVIRKGNESYVLIGDAILKEGERQGDLRIISIDRDRVVCKKGKHVVTLVLNE